VTAVDTAPAPPTRPVGRGHLTIGSIALRFLGYGVLSLLVFALPRLNADYAQTGAYAAIFAITALSLNILIGYTGQLSLGHQGFLGVGALTAAYFQAKQGLPFGACLLAGLLIGAAVALLLGLVALRITGLYLALITLVFGLTLKDSLFQVSSLTNGGAGQPADRPSVFIENYRYYLFCLAVLAAVVYLDRRITGSKTGRALLALKENERVAAAFGINVTLSKLLAFVLAGGIAGLAGGLFAFNTQQFSGVDYDFNLALTFVVMTVVGGPGSRPGVIIGGAFFAVLNNGNLIQAGLGKAQGALGDIPGLGSLLYGQTQQFVPDIIGALLLLQTIIFNPNGIATIADPVARWLSFKKFELHAAAGGPGAVEGSNVRA